MSVNPRISMAFCFDGNWVGQAAACFASLLDVSRGKCSYDMYCVVPDELGSEDREKLSGMVAAMDADSALAFLAPNNDFDGAQKFIKHTSLACYWRLMLPALLPHLDRVIYSDVDVIFKQDMCEAWSVDLEGKDFAAVRDALINIPEHKAGRPEYYLGFENNEYTYGGFLVMNLKKIRESGISRTWIEMAANAGSKYQDQDILNLASKKAKAFLPPKYVLIPYMVGNYTRSIGCGIYSAADVDEAERAPAIIHYCGAVKPWNYDKNLDGGEMFGFDDFWRAAKMTPFYGGLQKSYDDNKMKYRVMVFAAMKRGGNG